MFGLSASLPTKSADLRQAEDQFDALNARCAKLQVESGELSRLLAPYADKSNVGEKLQKHRDRLKAIGPEITATMLEANAAQVRVAELRPAYGKALASALAARRKTAAEEILLAIAKIEFATGVLSETHAQIDKAGGHVTSLPSILATQEVRAAASQILTEE
jgi:hypothetical protein